MAFNAAYPIGSMIHCALSNHIGAPATTTISASINLTDKYKGYKSERVKQAVQDIYDELNAPPSR